MPSSSNYQYPRIGVGVIILRGKEVLLGLRKGPRSPGYYGLPGGYLENHESFEECAKREVLEETGLRDLGFQPIYLIGGSTDSSNYADIIFYAKLKNNEPTVKERDRVEKWEWFNIFALPSPLYKPTELALHRFITDFYFHKMNLFLHYWFPRRRMTVLYVDSMTTEEYKSK